MKIVYKLLLILTILVSAGAEAEVYALVQGGYGFLNQKDIAAHNVHPAGLVYGAGVGARFNYFELEGSFSKLSATGDIKHDGESNSIKHDQSSFLIALNFYLNKKFYARLGYGLYKIDQTLEKEVSSASEAGARKAYGLKENSVDDGVVYGAGYVFYESKSISVYTQIENQVISGLKANALNAGFGLKFYF